MTTTGSRAGGIEYVVAPSAAVQDAAGVCAGGLGSAGLGAFLSPQERDALVRFSRAADRLDYAASHALFRLLAARRLGLDPADAAWLEIRRSCATCGSTEHGKPSIDGVALSMSRSHGTVMAAAAPAGTSLGADVEQVPNAVFAGFDAFALAPGEQPGSEHTSAEGADAGRIRLWVAKEAVLKAAGIGLAVDPSAVRLVPAGPGGTAGPGSSAGEAPGTLRAECADTPSVHGLLVTSAPAPAGYAAAVAAPGLPGPDSLPGRAVSLAEIFATKV
ncbi:4'-phosphopantetheinyl transferase family protein [Pseudarthrobacter sp. 1C304]|uniref:4'-phosphopantetheinyl transferase family protein n=1 Tax=Pseudarthrobacter sp. 1C304 TaxID=3457438 RepID=UPI003FD2C203